jgi:hypothetical protein
MIPDVLSIIAWGQYLHWAELQFRRYLACEEGTGTSEVLGSAAHWLAAEYVVQEGWREIGASDEAIERVLMLYPEHSDILRRCRNAVYHFQKEVLDKRILHCITDDSEELSVAAALHFEFQRYLFQYPYRFSGSADDISGLRADITACIGWFPDDSAIARVWRVQNQCLKLVSITEGDSTNDAQELRAMAASSLDRILQLDVTPMTSRLKRIQMMS